MSKIKISQAQVGQMMKLAGEKLLAQKEQITNLSSELDEAKQQVAQYQKRERVEKLAGVMEQKGLRPDLSHSEKIDHLMGHEKLDAVEEAISMNAPQVKTASVHDGTEVATDGGEEGGAESRFIGGLASLE